MTTQTELSKAVAEINRAARSLFGTALKQIGDADKLTPVERAALFEKCQANATWLWSITRPMTPPCAGAVPLDGAPATYKATGPQVLETEEQPKAA